ncbi:hypothetical protein NBRC116600_04700 [Thalassotalea sp. SU-HH00458]
MENKDNIATRNDGLIAKTNAPIADNKKAEIITGFSEYFSTKIPDGIDITPYATKNAKGKKPANPTLSSKLCIMSGIKGPKIFVKNEITKKTTKTKATTIKLVIFNLLIFLFYLI